MDFMLWLVLALSFAHLASSQLPTSTQTPSVELQGAGEATMHMPEHARAAAMQEAAFLSHLEEMSDVQTDAAAAAAAGASGKVRGMLWGPHLICL